MIACRVSHSALRLLLLLALLAGPIAPVAAQEGRIQVAAFGDPPLASLITISEPDENGLVVIRGAPGAVFPGAVVAIRNLYTGQTVYPRAELTGAFLGEIYGPGNTPFWISPASRIESFERNVPGALPGGPGIILYGPLPERYTPPPLPEPPEPALPVTPITLDGLAAEWSTLVEPVAISVAEGADALVYALANTDSLYLAVASADPTRPLPAAYTTLEIMLEVEGQRFLIRVDPRRGSGGRLYGHTSSDGLTDLGPLGGYSVQGSALEGAIELRLPRMMFTGSPASIIVTAVRFRTEGLALTEDTWTGNLYLPVSERQEADSPEFLPYTATWDAATPFTLSGPVGGGSGTWHAWGRIDRLAYSAGETLYLEMQVALQAPAMPGDGTGLRLGADLWLEPVTVNGAQTIATPATGNGWSGTLTPSGLPVENVDSAIWLGDTTAQKLTITDGTLTFALRWALPLAADIPPGLYALSLTGYAAVPGLHQSWGASGLLGSGTGIDVPQARLPLIVQIGGAGAEQRLIWSLFQDQPSSSGARGVLPQEDAGRVAVTGRVAYGGGVYVLPRVNVAGEPIAYPLEPYLPALLGNSFYQAVPPLIPFAFDSGELTVSVTRPDGTQDDLGSVPIVQNRLGTAERIESAAFGADSPLDIYRLTTLDPRLTAYTFPQDGLYRITLTGTLRDIWGHTYTGGGTYEVWAAEPLQMLPGVLPGTPFEVGDVFNPALTVTPAFPAEVNLRLTVYPLDGRPPQTREVTGTANRHGHFFPAPDAEAWVIDTPGEYVADITARYTDGLGRLWMGTVRGAGVIASPEGRLVARGGRWLAGQPAEDRLAWYMVENRAPEVFLLNPAARMRWPYHSGDVLWVPDGRGRLQAGLRLTDPDGAYAAWLRARLATWTDSDGNSFDVLANEDELPVQTLNGNRAYAYLSAVRPGVTARSMILGGEGPTLARYGWTPDDPYNYQRGVGVNGDLPGDYAFLFGGLVVHNDDLDLHETAIYGALAMTIPANDPIGGRVFPLFFGEAGGSNGGPLLTIDGRPVEMFFILTGFQPGQMFTVGETLALAGQVAPTLPATVTAQVTMPSGRILHIGGQANAVGYYYDPSQNLPLTEPGLWRLKVRVSYSGVSSAGQVYPPYPSGGVPGAGESEIFIYVLPEEAPVVELTNPRGADIMMPVALPFNLTLAVPGGWQNVRMVYTVVMNGMILDSGIQPAYGGIFAYNYDPRRLNQRFPNLDTTFQGTLNPHSADGVRITLVLIGTDATGQEALAGRTLALFGDRLLTLYAGWPAPEESTP